MPLTEAVSYSGALLCDGGPEFAQVWHEVSVDMGMPPEVQHNTAILEDLVHF